MNKIDEQAKTFGFPILVETPSFMVNPHPYSIIPTFNPALVPTVENPPDWYKLIQVGTKFKGLTNSYSFKKSDPEEMEYLDSLHEKLRRKTNVVWITGYKPAKDDTIDIPDTVPGLFTFKALTCPTI
ncbi:Oidioi.mRNA.OKI2018_I69.XSR.g14638.t1.cds [Oikopleura dioica]|uniref:Oidioi.mRNA.OKI2018_I69.XSR.g14638.t1.cds n=1 Tax=Oikopleura dioica TaxID=34765 RepID=A0ABN7SFM0_OIKDI|nr:Oidioi.mRNA.OKI2018_I69.XSR.g14638.t1.cds [Oikopleura dioica]